MAMDFIATMHKLSVEIVVAVASLHRTDRGS